MRKNRSGGKPGSAGAFNSRVLRQAHQVGEGSHLHFSHDPRTVDLDGLFSDGQPVGVPCKLGGRPLEFGLHCGFYLFGHT